MRGDRSAAVCVILFLFALPLFLDACTAFSDFDFFYFVLQWPGSMCDTKRSCCYPKTGKPAADFGIHGLWPNNNDGSYPSNCDPDSSYDHSQMSDLISSMEANWPSLACPSGDGSKFWGHEWEKHGTCAEAVLDQHSYFQTALSLKKKLNLLQVLSDAGIRADGGYYSLQQIKEAIREGTGGFAPGIQCNVDEAGNSQLYQVYLCVHNSGAELIDCPIFPRGGRRCASRLQIPVF